MKPNNIVYIAKALTIILMVIGHSGCPDWMNQYLYIFHMPLFFFISGFLFKDKYLINSKSYIINKINGLYVPFFKWAMIFLLLHNLFYSFGIYSNLYNLDEFRAKVFKIIIMTDTEALLGGYWFLRELFLVSIIAYCVIWLCDKMKSCKCLINIFNALKKSIIPRQAVDCNETEGNNGLYIFCLTCAAIVCLILSYLSGVGYLKIPMLSSRLSLSCFMFMCGYIAQKSNPNSLNKKSWVIGYVIIALVIYVCPDLRSMDSAVGSNLLPYVIGALSGTLAVCGSSYLIDKHSVVISDFLKKIGLKTFYILTFHFIAFKLVSLFMIKICGVEGNLYDFPVIQHKGLWWILYSLIGVAVPICLWHINRYLNDKGVKWRRLIGKS